MAGTEEDFLELLGGEVYIDMERLVDTSRHGIPEKVRGEVWKHLLEVSKPDKSEEERQKKQQQQDYRDLQKNNNPEITKKVRHQLKRYRVKDRNGFFQTPEVRTRIENVIVTYTSNNTDVEYQAGMLSLLGPFVVTLPLESDIFFCFSALMKKIEQDFDVDSIPNKVARFMMYFRSVQPELFNHFEEEEINSNDWAPSWLQFLLSNELPLDCVLRLWDTYFSGELGLELHIYVCLVILVNCAEELLEMDNTEILSFLQHLPIMDMEVVIAQAHNLRDEIRASNEL